ncbi:hypothetical protein SEVIR_9G195900v4 [Setaria viridis]
MMLYLFRSVVYLQVQSARVLSPFMPRNYLLLLSSLDVARQMYLFAAEIPCLSLHLSIEEKFSSGYKKSFLQVPSASPRSNTARKRLARATNATMHASRARAMLPLLSVCAVALLLSPASADPALLDPAVGGDSWHADSPAEAPTAVAGTLGWAEDEVAGGIAVAPGRRAFRPRHQPSALSPEQRRDLEHESRCGPRVPVRGGVFPWPGCKPRCRGGGDGGAATAPAVHHLQPLIDAP